MRNGTPRRTPRSRRKAPTPLRDRLCQTNTPERRNISDMKKMSKKPESTPAAMVLAGSDTGKMGQSRGSAVSDGPGAGAKGWYPSTT